ncbi:MAG: tetraacyldisaccharide 4'-kinase [Bdellovibrionota bacterium]
MIRIASRLRAWAYQRRLIKPVELSAFTLSVGNISLGGTGKSAFVMLLAEWAAGRALPTAVLSRGYKRRTRGMRLVGPFAPLPNESEIGDEPWMIKRRVPGVSLLVHADRARMAFRHWQELGEPRLVILDDAFQHWRCARDADVLMVDATESLEQRTLPFGRLRETVLAARRADLLVITRARAVSPDVLARLEKRLLAASEPRMQPTWKRSISPALRVIAADYVCSGFHDAVSGDACEPTKEREYLLVSGIAKPDHLRRIVNEAGLKVVEELYFPDHHRLTEADSHQIQKALSNLRNGCLLVTEKDWGRWKELFGRETPGVVISVKYDFLGNGARELEAFLSQVAKGAECFTLP